MLGLTPIEVRKKKEELPRALRGYETSAVDIFLELTADRLESLINEVRALESKLREQGEELESYRSRESALMAALVSAESLGAEVRRQAEEDAELIRRAAEVSAGELKEEAMAAVAREEDELRRIRARKEQAIRSYRTFLERELAELTVEVESEG